MSFLSRLSSLFALKQKTAVKLIAIMSVFAFVINLTPELYRDVASQASEEGGDVTAAAPPSPPSAGPYIIVDAGGNASSIDTDDCTLWPASTPFPPMTSSGECTLDEAISEANGDTDNRTITIIFSNAWSLSALAGLFGGDPVPTNSLTVNLPTINRPSGYPLVIDGALGTGKISLADGSTGNNTLTHFFRIGSSQPSQHVTIKNIAFTRLLRPGAVAITTDVGTTPTPESGNIASLIIENNYFGTTDGITLTPNRAIWQAAKIFVEPSSVSDVIIRGNNVYNSVAGFEVGTADDFNSTSCLGEANGNYEITNNIIGLNKDKGIDRSYAGVNIQGAWSLFAVKVCNIDRANIRSNTIGNSLGKLPSPLGLDTAIDIKNSSYIVRDNNIGIIKNSDGSFATDLDWGIVGYGIKVEGHIGDFDDDRKSYIAGNSIANIFTALDPTVITTYCNSSPFVDLYDINQADSAACGGSGILLVATKDNLIYNNIIGHPLTPNFGYGIEIQGVMSQFAGTSIFAPTFDNEIFKNIISYNLADGVFINTIKNFLPDSEIPANQLCKSPLTIPDLSGVTEQQTNNCQNTLIQNAVLRNGRYNAANFCVGQLCTGSPEGGIGYDLKVSTDTTEQKYASVLSPYTGSGTTNDTDITVNDSNDSDRGANDAINTPVLYGSGSDLTGIASSARTMRGNLSGSTNGRYWVEVFAVNCPAEFLSTTPTITWDNASTNCDTDSPTLSAQNSKQTYGQGFIFLCGVYVNKTSTNSDWSCDPGDYGNSYSGGLITATASALELPLTSLAAAADNGPSNGADQPAPGIGGTPPSPISDFPGIDPLNPPRFSCQVINIYAPSSPGCAGRAGNFSPPTTDPILRAMLAALSNSSEFSRNVFIAAPDVGVSKNVRSCTGPLPEDCTGSFSPSTTRQPGQYVEFKIDLQNNSTTGINVNLNDDAPIGLTFLPSTCIYFSGLTTIPNDRPSTGSSTCGIVGSSSITIAPPTTLAADSKVSFYILARVNTDALAGPHVNTARVFAPSTSCTAENRCTATANVIVEIQPTANLVKTIQSPDTNSNLDNETLNAPTAQTTTNYRIVTTLTGVTKANVDSLIITDNFPKTISTTQVMDYSTSNCQFTMQRNGGPATTAQNCDNLTNINSTNLADLAIWHGTSLNTAFPTFSANDTFVITINYRGLVPANPLLSSDPQSNITNVAKFIGTGFTTQTDNTTLTITPPSSTPVVPTFHKQVRACTGTTADTCTGAFSETGLSNVAPGSTVEFRFEATSSSGATFAFRDPAPTGITFATSANSCLAYAGIAQLSGSAARPTTGSSPCTFDATSGTQILNTSNVTIAANQYAYVYALATISSTATGTITNTAGLNGNGCSTTVAQCNDPATITITATTPGQVSIDKQVNPTAVTSSATTQDVTYTIVLTKPNTFAINNANWTDTFPTTPVALSNYTCTSVSVLPAGSQTIACPTTFPPAGNTLFTGTINAAVTSITITYTARVPANAVTTTAQSVVNSTSITGARSTDAVAISQTDTATLTVNPANASGTPVVSLSKRADNGVTTSDRSTEKIYKPGDTVNYTLSMLNSGASAATGVSLQDLFHSMLKSMTINALPAGATQSLTTTTFNFGNITVPTGTTPTTVTYHGTIADNDNFDLDLFDLDEGSNPARDDDFYASKDADIDDDLGTSNNSHRRAEDILGAPDNKFVSLGSDGEMTIDLGTKVIVNGSGDDFALRTINQSVDDTDQAGEDLKVSVSQDGTTFKTINPRSGDGNRYDLSKARMSWVRYIRLQDESSSVQAKAPGTDIDAICLLNIGVQLPNRVNMSIGSQSAFATEYVTVDVTKVFDKKPSANNCDEPEQVVVQEQLPPAPPAPLPPAPVYIPTPPPALPKTGAEPLVLVSLVSSLAWVFTRKKK